MGLMSWYLLNQFVCSYLPALPQVASVSHRCRTNKSDNQLTFLPINSLAVHRTLEKPPRPSTSLSLYSEAFHSNCVHPPEA